MTRWLLISFVALGCISDAQAMDRVAPKDVSLDGRWVANLAASDDGDRMIDERMAEMSRRAQRMEEQRRRELEQDPRYWEPEFTPPERTPQNRAAMEERQRATRQMVGLTKSLVIKQQDSGARLELVTDFDTRRFTAGERSQVSMPQGQLADLRAGWDGEWFVIERISKGGPRITEKYRRLKKTDQLEAQVTIRGSTALSGLKVRRIFDRAVGEAPPSDPNIGPVR